METNKHNLSHYKALLLRKLEEVPFDSAAVNALKWLTGVTFADKEEAVKWLRAYL